MLTTFLINAVKQGLVIKSESGARVERSYADPEVWLYYKMGAQIEKRVPWTVVKRLNEKWDLIPINPRSIQFRVETRGLKLRASDGTIFSKGSPPSLLDEKTGWKPVIRV